MSFKIFNCNFFIAFFTQHLSLSILTQIWVEKKAAFFRV